MPPPHIIHVVNSLAHGGAERVVLDLAAAQHDVIGKCEVICLHALGELAPEFTDRGIVVTAVPRSTRGVLPTAWHLAGLLRIRQPRVVHAHNVAPEIVVALGRRLRPWGNSTTRLICTVHGRVADERMSLLSLRRWLKRDFDAMIGVSDDVRSQLIALGIGLPDRTHVIRNGVNLERFSVRPARPWNGVHRIVSVGRLAEIKGQDTLLDALASARHELEAVELTLVGDGPARGTLEAQASRLGLTDIVRFAGAQQDVRPLLHAADLFVLPSRSEGVSIALLEAMASGLPIVATAVGGTPEVTGPGRGGLLVRPNDPPAMASAMVRLLTNAASAKTAGLAARRRVEEAFSLELTVTAYEGHYGLTPSWHATGT